MTATHATTRLEEARDLAKTLLTDFDKGLPVTRIARKCEHLGRLIDDPFIQAYVGKCVNWDEHQAKEVPKLVRRLRAAPRDDQTSGVVQFLEDIKLTGPSVPTFLLGVTKEATFTFNTYSLPAAEAFIQSARKTVKYKTGETDFVRTLEQTERVVDRVSTRLHRYVSNAYLRLRFGDIPESIFEATRQRVDRALASKCPAAVEKFSVAYEELTKNSSENWSNACLAVRRVLLDFADAVYPARDGVVDGHAVGPEDYVNRLWAYASEQLRSARAKQVVRAELGDLGARIDSIYNLSNKGLHESVTRHEADRIVIRTYLLLADLMSL